MLDAISRQFDIGCSLLDHHLQDLSTEECHWHPSGKGPRIAWLAGRWTPTWPIDERYEAGPPSIGWIGWHICMWWSMAIHHNFRQAELSVEDIECQGSAELLVAELVRLRQEWKELLVGLRVGDDGSEWQSRWPFSGGSLLDLLCWANLELMKNASEIGYVRFLYHSQPKS